MVPTVVDIDLFCRFPLSSFVLGVARAALFRVIRVLEDGLILFGVFLKIEILFEILKL